MSGVIRNDRCLKLSDLLFESTDLIFLHIDGTEYEIDLFADLFDIFCTFDDHILHIRRHFTIDLPSSLYGLRIRLTCGTRRCNYCNTLKPRMIVQ